MHLIIDAYNLLGVLKSTGNHSEVDRESLLQRLAAYRLRKGHALTVVFDGWRQGQISEHREHRMGLQVIYSKRGEQADQVIQRLAREYRSDCAVVSSDHEIIATARAQGALVLRAHEFAGRLDATQRFIGGAHKELDSGEDEPQRRQDKKGNPRKLPKAVRRRSKQLRRF
ncbi:MAG TPA: NYN domain-containing protein [Nitrospira sp.]|nr:NYN domain-containing protein [Nitrospira sp.]